MELDLIKNTIELYSGVDISEVTRKQNVLYLRIIYYRIAKDMTFQSLSVIGKTVNKDHATVLHALKNFDTVMMNKYYKRLYEDILTSLVNEDSFNRAERLSREEKIEGIQDEVWQLRKKLKGFEDSLTHPIFNELISLSDAELTDFNETRLKPYKKSLESRIYQASGCGVSKSRWEFNK